MKHQSQANTCLRQQSEADQRGITEGQLVELWTSIIFTASSQKASAAMLSSKAFSLH